MRRRLVLPTIAATALLLAWLAPTAGAHAVPVSTTPASGAVVQVAPREVVLRFSEALDRGFSGVEVLDANRTAVNAPSVIDADGVTMRAALSGALPYGSYTISWRALSAVDGHTTRGLASFLYPDPSKPIDPADLPPVGQGAQSVVGPLDVALRGVAFVGLYLAAGAAMLALAVVGTAAPSGAWPEGRRLGQLALGGALAGAAATVLLAASSGAAAADVPLAAALGRVDLLFAGRFGSMAGLRAPLLVLAGALALAGARAGVGSPRGRALWGGSLAASAGAFATVSLSSHAAALRGLAEPAIAADWLHLLASAAWVGGLAGLAWVLWKPASEALPWARVAARFSAVATLAVAVVVLTGVAAALLHLASLDALVGSAYGQVLLAKVGLVLVVLGFGGYNRLRVIPAMQAPDAATSEGARRAFRRSARAEAALGVVVILLAGALTAVSPPVSVAAQDSAAVFEATRTVDDVTVTLLITPYPVRVGFATVDAFLTQGNVSLADARGGNFTFVPPDRSLGSSTTAASSPHPGHFAAEGAFFTMPGPWKVRVLVQRTDAFDVLADFDVPVEP